MREIDKIIPAINRQSWGQIRHIESICLSAIKRGLSDRRECYILLAELAQHGSNIFPAFEEFISKFDNDPRSIELRKIHQHVYECASSALHSPEACLDETARKNLYHPQHSVFFEGKHKECPIVIVFTTSYNNFYVSNPVFGELLAQAGFSFLFLKDPSGYQYTRGIPAISSEWESSIKRVKEFISAIRKKRKVIVIGFSSSGFSSILASLKLIPDLAIGFSIRSTMLNNGPLPRSKVILSAMYDKIPMELQCDLRQKLADTPFPIRLFYGEKSAVDKMHAVRLAAINRVTVSEIPAVGHICFRPFLGQGDFSRLLEI